MSDKEYDYSSEDSIGNEEKNEVVSSTLHSHNLSTNQILIVVASIVYTLTDPFISSSIPIAIPVGIPSTSSAPKNVYAKVTTTS